METVFEAKDIDYINESMLKMLFETPGAEVMGTLTEKKRRKFGMRKENDPKDPKSKSGQSEKYGETFDKFWSVYPRKERKAEAFKCYTARIKDGYDPEQILKAAENYAECCRRENKENRYILMARTFLGVNLNFTDYLKKAGEGGTQVVKPSSKNRFNNFEQRQYDYSAYEKQLLKASHSKRKVFNDGKD